MKRKEIVICVIAVASSHIFRSEGEGREWEWERREGEERA